MTRQVGGAQSIVLKHWNELPPPLFILAPPRSFTSLACAMFGQHPQMYGLPETHLLRFETMAERTEHGTQATYPMADGVLRAVAQLYFGEQTEAAIRKARHWLSLRSHLTTDFMFRVLMDRIFPRIPVDKSPDMADHPEVLKRVWARFPQARFIHLLRRPRGHAESVMKHLRVRTSRGPIPHTHWLLRISSLTPLGAAADGRNENPVLDPQYGWYAINRTISQFLRQVPPGQSTQIRGEDLLAEPDKILTHIAAWMGLRTDSEALDRMKHPERIACRASNRKVELPASCRKEFFRSLLMEALLAFLLDKFGEIVDVACGKGATTRYLLKYYRPANVTGIHISEKQLRRCRVNAPQCKFFHMNATSMTFADIAFDHMICVEAAHHFDGRESFLKGSYRILRPGGRLVLSDMVPSTQPAGGGLLCPRQSFMSPLEYKDLYSHAGFAQVEIVDATRECIFGLRRHILRSLRESWLGGAIDLATFHARRSRIREKEETTGHYLLVCAQKGYS